jgi:hypothetical protein
VTVAAQTAVDKGFLIQQDAQTIIDEAKNNPPVK